jgi:hypothetical protein
VSINPQRAHDRLAHLMVTKYELERAHAEHLQLEAKLTAELRDHVDKMNDTRRITADHTAKEQKLRRDLSGVRRAIKAADLVTRITSVEQAIIKQREHATEVARRYPTRLAQHLRRCRTLGRPDPLGRTEADIEAARKAAEEHNA